MTTTTLTGAIAAPQDPGTGIGSNDDPNSAALAALLATHVQGTYVPTDGGLNFKNIDTNNNDFALGEGYCFILDDVSDTTNSRGSGGRPQVQSAVGNGYDTELPDGAAQAQQPYVVIVPASETGLALDAGTNDVFLSLDPTSQNAVTVHHGSGVATPSEPYIDLGTIDAGDGSTTRPNDLPPVDARKVTTGDLDATQLVAALDAAGYDISNVGALDATTLSVDNTLTGPAGNSYTDLSNLEQVTYVQSGSPSSPTAGETWFDTDTGIFRVYADLGSGADWHPIPPVQVLEEASTFAESDVTVTHSFTEVSGDSIQLLASTNWVDDWEDGDITGWSGDTGSLTNQTTTVLRGNETGEFNSSNALLSVTSPQIGPVTGTIKFRALIDNQTGDSGDEVAHRLFSDAGTRWGRVKFLGNGNVQFEGSTINAIGSWTANTTHSVTLIPDYSNNEATVYFDGSKQGTFSFESSASDFDEMRWINNTSPSGSTVNAYVDDADPPSSGDALIEWDSAVPADIASYDLATFQETLDGETVTVDVEDANQNVLFSDIGQNFDISTVATSKEVKLRVNLSRNDTANNPTCDYLARRFTR